MKYKVDRKWTAGRDIADALTIANEHLQFRGVPTSTGRTVILLSAATPQHAADIFKVVGEWRPDLQASRGLCTMLYQKPKGDVCLMDASVDGVIGVFSTDQGFRRSKQSIVVTAAHEAMHTARMLAAKDLELPPLDAPLTRAYEEAIADWTGYLTQEFLSTLGLLSL